MKPGTDETVPLQDLHDMLKKQYDRAVDAVVNDDAVRFSKAGMAGMLGYGAAVVAIARNLGISLSEGGDK